MNPLVIPCPTHVNCPGSDNPFANLTMEAPDSEIFIGINFGPTGLTPPLGWSWTNPRGVAFCGSNASQSAADTCASTSGFIDTTDDPPTGDGGHWRDPNNNPPIIYSSDAQVCSVQCPDGSFFTYQLAAGQFLSLVKADANAQAKSFACTLASVNKICIGTFTQSACIEQEYDSTIDVTGHGPFTVTVFGMLPPGLELSQGSSFTSDNALILEGTPTVVGNYSFDLLLVNPAGNSVRKTFTIVVWGFANSATLPEYSTGTPYTFTFAGQGGAPPYTFSPATGIDIGVLSGAGLSLSSAGVLSGTPTSNTQLTFNVLIQDSNGLQCIEEFTLPIPPGPDWTKLVWVTEGGTVQAAMTQNGVTLTLGSPAFPQNVGSGASLDVTYAPNGNISLSTDGTLNYTGPVPVNCKVTFTLFNSLHSGPNDYTISVSGPTTFFPPFGVGGFDFTNLGVGTTEVDFVLTEAGTITVVVSNNVNQAIGTPAFHYSIALGNR